MWVRLVWQAKKTFRLPREGLQIQHASSEIPDNFSVLMPDRRPALKLSKNCHVKRSAEGAALSVVVTTEELFTNLSECPCFNDTGCSELSSRVHSKNKKQKTSMLFWALLHSAGFQNSMHF